MLASPPLPAGRRRIPSPRVRLLVLALAFALGLCILEIGVRRFVPVRNVGPAFSVFDPVYGKSLKRSFHCTRTSPEFRMSFSTNALGFRGPEPARFPDHGILILGDSLTMGHGVDDGKEYPAVIAAALDRKHGPGRVPVVNAGVGATGNGRWIKFLRLEAERFAPRFVVLQVCSNDAFDNWREGLFSLDERGELVEEPVPAPSWKRYAQRVVDAVPGLAYSHVVSFLREDHSAARTEASGVLAAATAPPTGPGPREALTLALVERAIEMCRERGWPVLVLTVDLGDADERFLPWMEALCGELGVPMIRAPSRGERPDLYFEVDRHWRAAGHQVVGELVLDALRVSPALADAAR